MSRLWSALFLLAAVASADDWQPPKVDAKLGADGGAGQPSVKSSHPEISFFKFRIADGKLLSDPATEADAKHCRKCVSVSPQPGVVLLFDSIRSYDWFLVQDCAKAVPLGYSKRVDEKRSHACSSDPPKRQQVQALYDIERTEAGVRLGLSARFVIPGDKISGPRARQLWLSAFNGGAGAFIGLLSRYGVRVDYEDAVTYAGSSTDGDPSLHHPEVRINLLDDTGRAVTRETEGGSIYHFRGQYPNCAQCLEEDNKFCEDACSGLLSEEFRETMAHETGHLFGLWDEYADAKCPDRPLFHEEAPTSLMRQHDDRFDLADEELFPRHIAAIFSPLCAGTKAIIADGEPSREYANYEILP